jgi:cyclic pyranopterin phosphate synthase
MAKLTHFDDDGNARMVAVSEKQVTHRLAMVSGKVQMLATTASQIADRSLSKGDVISVARLAGIMAAKKTSDLIPLCHPIALDSVQLGFEFENETTLVVTATVLAEQKTGVEMEAFTAVSVACLTIYDMCKSVDRSMKISEIQLERKSGGKSGDFDRANQQG